MGWGLSDLQLSGGIISVCKRRWEHRAHGGSTSSLLSLETRMVVSALLASLCALK